MTVMMNRLNNSEDKGGANPNDSAILAEQTSQIYASVNTAIIATFINSIILAIVLWPVIEHHIIIIWLSSLILLSLVRGISAYRYKILSPSTDKAELWCQRFLIGSVLASIIWGSSSIWLFPTEDLARQVFLAFVLGGMAAGAVTSLSTIKLAVYIYLGFTLIPLLIRFFYSGTELSIAMGTMVLLYFIVLFQSANRNHNSSKQNICMRIENIKQAEELKESENRYKTLLDTATDAFFLHDVNGKFHDVNQQACHSLGYTHDELLKMSVQDIEKNMGPEVLKQLWSNLKEGENTQVEGTHLRKDGSSFPVEVSLGLIKIKNEQLLSVLARDVTERKRIEKLKNEFISTVSHELRTPLTSIRGSLGLLSGGAVGELPKEAQEMLAVAGNNTERLLFLINDLLDIQKIESEELEMKYQNIDIIPFLQQVLKDNEAYSDQYKVKFVLVDSISQELKNPQVYADKARLMQVMANLLSNAAKFSHENGKVEISTSRQDDDIIRVSVTDHGPGIPEEFQSKLFEKFTQFDSSDTRQKGGTGLGLNISKAIIEKHGGKIDFTSKEGVGSTFYIDLPALISNTNT